MRFDTEAMTPEQRAANEAAAAALTRGKYYQFSPPVTATAIPAGGPNVHPLTDLQFEIGWYIGFVNGQHVFQGRAANDPRTIDDRLRECFFHVAFVGGSSIQEVAAPGA